MITLLAAVATACGGNAMDGTTWQMHGREVPDPYVWLEDEHNPSRQSWLDQQDKQAGAYFKQVQGLAELKERLAANSQYERFGVPVQRGKLLFYTKQNLDQAQPALYLREADGSERVLVDPTAADSSGSTSLADYSVSPDGSILAYAFSEGGSDWRRFRFMDISTGEHLPDTLEHLKFSEPSWGPKGQEVFYWAFDAPPDGADFATELSVPALYRHVMGTAQQDDQELYRPSDPRVAMGFLNALHITDDERYLVFYTAIGCDLRVGVHLCDLKDPDAAIQTLLPIEKAMAAVFAEQDGKLLMLTDLDAPNGRVVSIDLKTSASEQWQELIPESQALLQDACLVDGKIALAYLRDAHAELELCSLDGKKLLDIELPGHGTIIRRFHGIALSAESSSSSLYFAYSDFLRPTCIMRYDANSDRCEPLFQPQCSWNPDDYCVQQEFCKSADGARIPYFIVHKKGLEKTGKTPTLLYGYGGFGIAITPNFSPSQLTWLQEGGILAVANLRGGGEYGESWHRDGRLDKKQNVFNDCFAVAQSLIDQGYTQPQQLAVHGHSNGGLLAGASLVQRPDLFAAAVVSVGVLDMLRFHKFTIGHAWISDYGSPDDPKDFEVLYSYSPYHNVKTGTAYPSTLITTADHDDRVVPLHSFKFAGALQEAQGGQRPVILRVHKQTGHGAGKSRQQEITEGAEILSFLKRELSGTALSQFQLDPGSTLGL